MNYYFERKPGLTGRGVYELKPEYYEQYNPFFYHYSASDHSKVLHFNVVHIC